MARLYLSQDTTLGSGDRVLAQGAIPALQPEPNPNLRWRPGSFFIWLTGPIANFDPRGQWSLFLVLDAGNQVTETNETNNVIRRTYTFPLPPNRFQFCI